jgi:hypothetical protein
MTTAATATTATVETARIIAPIAPVSSRAPAPETQVRGLRSSREGNTLKGGIGLALRRYPTGTVAESEGLARCVGGLGRRDERDPQYEENGGDSEPDRSP